MEKQKHCPLAFSSPVIFCSEERCQWWDIDNNCCLVKTIIKTIGHYEYALSGIHEELKKIRQIDQIMNSNVME